MIIRSGCGGTRNDHASRQGISVSSPSPNRYRNWRLNQPDPISWWKLSHMRCALEFSNLRPFGAGGSALPNAFLNLSPTIDMARLLLGYLRHVESANTIRLLRILSIPLLETSR